MLVEREGSRVVYGKKIKKGREWRGFRGKRSEVPFMLGLSRKGSNNNQIKHKTYNRKKR